ncbi:unnamed protein product [Rotaria sordida]|uniref:RNA-directed DNA polymerase n=2 Tax=Rotaria sordida TaxID=392033 RepID=A0A819HJM6_9BILA|nr:unnamed protein product [Rotaria sordida]
MPSSSTSPNPFFIHAQINHTYHNILLDTGFSITIIHNRFLQRIYHNTFEPSQNSYISANCTTINIIGKVQLEIKINGLSTFVTASVASSLVTDVLVGTDWINQYVLCLDVSTRRLTLQDTTGHTTTTSLIQSNNTSCCTVRLLDQITIPQYSESIITATVHLPDSSNLLFEPSSSFNQKAVILPTALITVTNSQTHLTIVNTTNHPYTLSSNTCLGTVSSSSLICAITSQHQFQSTQFQSSKIHHRSPNSSHKCYVCHQRFLSQNNLFHHLRVQCYPPELRHQIETLTRHIDSTSHRKKIQDVLWKYGKLFDLRQPSKINITLDHVIDTDQHRPIYTPPYRRSPQDHQTITEETAKLLKQDSIEPSTSPWCSPVVLVRKKDGTTRFCVDYRKLNDITVKDSFPLPRIEDIFDQLSQSTCFTTLDFKSGYFQIPLAIHDRPKTAFSTRDNHYQFKVLPQGVKNGPPTFQRIVNQILGPARWKHCLAYLDDVVIFSRTFEDHISHLDEILCLLHTHNFRLSFEKCTIATDNIDYLGHHICRGEIRPNNDNIRGLLETSTPTTPKEIFRFLKGAEYYRKFIPNFSRIASPLYKYNPSSYTHPSNSKSTLFKLSIEEQAAFEQLKHILTTDLVLRLPNNQLPFKIQTDASQLGIGAVLLQTYPEGDRPICYMSKKLTPAQQRWSPIEQECYAIIKAVELWHHYLHGHHFILESDHKPLEALMRKSQMNDKCERWRLRLQSYDFIIKHIKGTSNTMPDYLSRSPVDHAEDDMDDKALPTSISIGTQTDASDNDTLLTSSIVGMVTTRSRSRQLAQSDHHTTTQSNINRSDIQNHQSTSSNSTITTDGPRIEYTGNIDQLKQAQQKDSDLQHITNNLTDDKYVNSYFLQEGLLMHHEHNSKPVPCVPKGEIRRDIMKIYHDTQANGAHFGRDKTITKIKARYYWNTMSSDITNYVKSCVRCNQNNPIRCKPAGHLNPIEPPEGVWHLLSMDFHGPITPTSRHGNKYIISITDVLSKFVIAKAVRDCTADTAARFLQEEVICKYGTPKCVLTDNGTHFTSNMMEHLLKRLGITHLYSTPYHPQTNGQIERFNSTMDAKIAALSNQCRSDWDDQLPFVIFNYNTSSHSTTKTIPFELMYGRSPVLPFDLQNPIVSLQQSPHYTQNIRQYISHLTNNAKTNIIHAQRQYKSRYDTNRSNPTYSINDLVLIKNIRPRHKFDIRYEGPFRIIRRLGVKTYLVQHVKLLALTRQVTVDLLIPVSTG